MKLFTPLFNKVRSFVKKEAKTKAIQFARIIEKLVGFDQLSTSDEIAISRNEVNKILTTFKKM